MAIELKKGQKINLQKKRDTALGEILINLNWHQPSGTAGKSKAVDLDLGCLYELEDGQKGSVQALGNSFGSLDRPPYIALDGDDRTGASEGGENLRVNGSEVSRIKRILVYTFIYEGVADWREVDGVVTLKCPGTNDIVVRMDEYDSRDSLCAIAMLENYMGQTLSVEKLVQFFPGQRVMDEAFHWGLKWQRGRK